MELNHLFKPPTGGCLSESKDGCLYRHRKVIDVNTLRNSMTSGNRNRILIGADPSTDEWAEQDLAFRNSMVTFNCLLCGAVKGNARPISGRCCVVFIVKLEELPVPTAGGPPGAASADFLAKFNSLARALNSLMFDFSTLRMDFDFKVFQFVKIELGSNVRSNAVALRAFIAAEAFGMFNDRTCAKMLQVMEEYVDQAMILVGQLLEAQETLKKVKRVYDRLNPSQPLRFTDKLVSGMLNTA